MIHYQLRCDEGHEFDGWFNGSAGFEKQAKLGLLECPECGTAGVERALMTPSVPRKGRAKAEAVAALEPVAAPAPVPAPSPAAVAVERLPDQVRAMLQKLRSEIEKNCDYVGPGFATEARRIHNGESDARAIYGETTPEEAEALAEDGIEVSRIPWVPRADG